MSNSNDNGKCLVCGVILDKKDANVCIKCDTDVYFNGKIVGNYFLKKKRITNSNIDKDKNIYIDVLKNVIFKK